MSNHTQGTGRLFRLRVSAGLESSEVAALCGVHERTYLGWEHGSSPIPEAQVALLADYYGVSRDYLLGVNGADT